MTRFDYFFSKILIACCFLFIVSCTSESSDLEYPQELINTWVESFEEGYGVFRPENEINYPTHLFRQIFTLKAQEECEFLVMSPIYGHYWESGRWEYEAASKTIMIYRENEELVRALHIEVLREDFMKVEISK